MRMSEVIKNRYEFIILFDVENGNPNGDPDAGNMPRIDVETGHGLVTDVCVKRKIRNYVELVKGDAEGYAIYVKEGAILNKQHEIAYIKNGIDINDKKALEKEYKNNKDIYRNFMCKNFYDIRAFGAVMDTGDAKCGQVRGPIQLNFAKSIDPIVQQEITITRVAITSEKDAEKKSTMGRKHIIPYALYRAEGYISAALAQKTGFDEDDLKLFWEAVINMFEHDHSAARGKMAVKKLIVFKHDSLLGNAPAYKLFDTVKVVRKCEDKPARSYEDYEVTINTDVKFEGVEVIEMA